MTLACITNDLRLKWPCVQIGAHLPYCTGTAKHDRTNTCEGCQPRPANHGLLCTTCHTRLDKALIKWPTFAGIIANLDRAIAADTGGRSSSVLGYIPIPKTRLDIDEVERHLSTYVEANANLGLWISNHFGARDAIAFTRLAERAFIAHPLEDKPRLTDKVRCMKCSQWSLEITPPDFYLDDTTIVCLNQACGLQMDQTSYELATLFQDRSAI